MTIPQPLPQPSIAPAQRDPTTLHSLLLPPSHSEGLCEERQAIPHTNKKSMINTFSVFNLVSLTGWHNYWIYRFVVLSSEGKITSVQCNEYVNTLLVSVYLSPYLQGREHEDFLNNCSVTQRLGNAATGIFRYIATIVLLPVATKRIWRLDAFIEVQLTSLAWNCERKHMVW